VGQGISTESRGGVTSQPPRGGAEHSASRGSMRNKGRELWWGNKPHHGASPVGLRAILKTELSSLGEELTRQSCSHRATQLLPDENNNRLDYLAQTGSKLP
jgi:hypothetical protein